MPTAGGPPPRIIARPDHSISRKAIAPNALRVLYKLREAGYEAFLVGGCLRDVILGLQPKDFDVATSATPDEVAALFPEAVLVGKAFGVVRAPVDGLWFELATFRRDSAYEDGRRPVSVSFATPQEDAGRRDFTINAMFFDPVARRLHDFAGGEADLRARLIRCVGDPDVRFGEDHLRLLRAVRFASVLDFALEAATAAALLRCAPRLARISGERIRDELTRILLESPRPGQALLQLQALGLLAAVLPELAAMAGQAQPPEFHPEGDVLTHTALMLDAMEPRSLPLAYAVLLHDVGKPVTAHTVEGRLRFDGHAPAGARVAEEILRRLRFAANDIDAIVHCVRDHMRFMDVKEMKTSTLRRLVGSPTFPVELELHRLDCLASHGKLDNYDFLRAYMERMAAEPVLPRPWASGSDLLALGVPEGPAVGRWLRAAYDAQLEGRFAGREALLAWLRGEVTAEAGAARPAREGGERGGQTGAGSPRQPRGAASFC